MRDFHFDEVDTLNDGDMSFRRLLGLVEKSSEGESLVEGLNGVQKKELVETLWIFAQLVTMEFDHED